MKLVQTVGLAAALLLAGCSSGGNDTPIVTGPVPNNPSVPNPDAPSSFTVQAQNFTGAQVATVIARYTPPAEDSPSVQASGQAARQGNEPEPPEQSPRTDASPDESPGLKDLPPEILQAEAADRGQAQPGYPGELRRFQAMNEGDTTTFYISTNAQTVTVRKMHSDSETQHCTVFAQLNGATPVANKARALEIAAAFDTNNPFSPGSGIYEQVRTLVGNEWTSGGGRDGDAKIAIVLLDSSGIGGSQYFGFFRPNDEFPKSSVSTSNEGEILYLNIDKFGADGFDLYSTLAHEFQHLCSFNVKFGREGQFNGQFEDSATDEGRSVLIEDLLGYGLDASGGGNQFIFNACRAFLQDTNSQGLFQFSGQSDGYGRNYTLHRYLVDRFGLSRYSQYARSQGSGLAQLNASFGPFQTTFADWTVALKADPLAGPVPAQYQYTSAFSPRGSYNIRGLGPRTLPGVQPEQVFNSNRTSFSVSLPPWSFANFEYTPGAVQNLTVTVSGNGNLNGNLVLENPRGTFTGVR